MSILDLLIIKLKKRHLCILGIRKSFDRINTNKKLKVNFLTLLSFEMLEWIAWL